MRNRTEIAEEAAIFAETTVDALMMALADREEPAPICTPHHKIRFSIVGQIMLPGSLRRSELEDRPAPKKAVPGRIYH